MLNLKYIDFFNNVHNKNVSYYNNDNLVSGLMDYCIYTFNVRPIETYKKICSFFVYNFKKAQNTWNNN